MELKIVASAGVESEGKRDQPGTPPALVTVAFNVRTFNVSTFNVQLIVQHIFWPTAHDSRF